jgi:hypothetical protein
MSGTYQTGQAGFQPTSTTQMLNRPAKVILSLYLPNMTRKERCGEC